MKDQLHSQSEIISIPVSDLGEKYGQLRVINPAADASMLKSLEHYGQLSPVVVWRDESDQYEVIDGFKRLRSSRSLEGFKQLQARVLGADSRARKAAILRLNWVGKSVSDMDEALVIQSLYREECLSQLEIGTLLDRHTSWISRRIALVERLSEEVQEHIRLGLISVSIGRELIKLPRGKQEAALSTIEDRGLTLRDTEKIVSALQSCPKHEQEAILQNPETILEETKESGYNRMRQFSHLSHPASLLGDKLTSLEQCSLSVAEKVTAGCVSAFTEKDIRELSEVMARAVRAAELAVNSLKNVLSSIIDEGKGKSESV